MVDFELQNKQIFQGYTATPMDEHVGDLKHQRKWGSAVELLAAATLFQIPVYTYTSVQSQKYRWLCYSPLTNPCVKFPDEPYPRSAKELHHLELLHASRCHYDVIMGKDCSNLLTTPEVEVHTMYMLKQYLIIYFLTFCIHDETGSLAAAAREGHN